MRDCLNKGAFSHLEGPLDEFLDSPCRERRASRFYAIFNGIQRDACANLKIIWQRDLGCEWTDEEWAKIIAESGRYIREARGKCIQYKIIHRFYYTPSRLHRIGVMDNNLCWKCKSVTGTLIHALWECGSVRPFWRKVLEHMETWLGRTLPVSPKLCLLGDRSEVLELSKYDYAVLKTGFVTASRMILQLWKSPGMPDLGKWREKMGEVGNYEKMLIRLGGGELQIWEGMGGF